MLNALVVEIFRGIARILEIKGDNPFRIRAYLRAAESVENLKEDIVGYVSGGRLTDIPGIGADLAGKIKEIAETGKCAYFEELKRLVPAGVVAMLEVPGIGPKSAQLFYERLKIDSLEKLKEAAEGGRLTTLPGVREKTVQNILKGLELVARGKERVDILTAELAADDIVLRLKKAGIENISLAGSLRRRRETVRDIDILAVAKDARRVIEIFTSLPHVKRVLASGETKGSILTEEDIQADLRVVAHESFGAALLYFTGSKNHNIRLRQLAIRKSLKINEYGVFDKRDRCVASKTEEEIYRKLGLDFIAPELREDRGEVEAARQHCLPRLLDIDDIRGDLHAHTAFSDGKNSVAEMAEAARRLGYEYICLTDHSVTLKVAGGLDAVKLREKKREVDRVNAQVKNFRVFFASEVEIDAEGRTDYKDDVLSRFDVVVGGIHSGFKQSRKQLTRRIVRACRNRRIHIIAHPTGRLWPTRDSYELDFAEVFKAARDTNTALEINSYPSRLDLDDLSAQKAKAAGVKLALGTDAHAIQHLPYMKFGVGLARRAWLEKGDVLNTLKAVELLKAIQK